MSFFFLYDYNDYNGYNYCKYYNYYSVYNDYNNYNDYRDSVLDLDLDWERFSELTTLVTKLTITDKLRKLNHDIENEE